MPVWISTREWAAKYGLSESGTYGQIRRGELVARKFGRSWRILDATPELSKLAYGQQQRLWDIPLFFPREVRALLHMPHCSLRWWIRQGKIKPIRVGGKLRYSLREIERLIGYFERRVHRNKQWRFFRPNTALEWAATQIAAQRRAVPSFGNPQHVDYYEPTKQLLLPSQCSDAPIQRNGPLKWPRFPSRTRPCKGCGKPIPWVTDKPQEKVYCSHPCFQKKQVPHFMALARQAEEERRLAREARRAERQAEGRRLAGRAE